METAVKRYSVEYSKDLWLSIVERFRNNISPNGVIYFKGDYDQKAESEFTKFCAERGLKVSQKIVLEYSGKGPMERPFYYLSVRDTREYEQSFVRFKCDGGGKGMCWYGAEQLQKVTVAPDVAKIVDQSDIAVKNYPISPRVYVVSRRLRELMEPLRFTGIAITPCLEAGHKYSDDEAVFHSYSAILDNDAKYFQMSITSRTPGKPSVGNLVAAGSCPRCHALSIIEGDKEMEFAPGDLGPQDFQWFGDVTTKNKGDQHMVGQIPLISARALGFFIENKIKGLRPYSSDPPIKYAAVQICG